VIETLSILDKATIKQLEATRPNKTERRQIKRGLLLHTKVLGELYKKWERDDLIRQEKAEAGRIQRAKAKKQQVSKKRVKLVGQRNTSGVLSESSEDESESESEGQDVSEFLLNMNCFKNLCLQLIGTKSGICFAQHHHWPST